MIAFPDMMVAPVLPADPTQADYGRQVYYYVCMACHGNLGQGLTAEWVAEWGENNSCWQSKCHASNHPEEGFKLPRTIPGVTGAAFLSKFGSAAVLHDFISASMPWQAPGSLSSDEYWQLTAYLIELNGGSTGDVPLDEQTATQVLLASDEQPAETPPPPAPVSLPVAAASAFAIVLLAAWLIYRRRARPNR